MRNLESATPVSGVGLRLPVVNDMKQWLSLLWIFVLLNYLYADVLALFAFIASPNTAPHLPQWALLSSAVFMEIPIAMIVACRVLPLGANRLANIITGVVMSVPNAFLTSFCL